MPTPGQPRLPLSAPLTRQQLDELEALMQRMLALPVEPAADVSDPAPAPAKENRTTPLANPPAPADNLVEPRPGGDRPLVVPALRKGEGKGKDDGSSAVPPPPHSPSRGEEEGKELPQPGAGQPDCRGRTVCATNEPSAVRLGLRPLVWCNQVFDAWTETLGPLGRWLRGPQGRAVLAWIGVLLLGAALAWVALDGMGWTW